MSGNEELLSDARNNQNLVSGSGISGSGNSLLETSSSNIDDSIVGSPMTECCDESCERPVDPISRGKYPITIHHLDFGYNVKIGCQTFAVETPEKLVKNLEAYLKDPSGTERKWLNDRQLL